MDLPGWQALREEIHEQGCEIVTVALEASGPEAARPFVERAQPAHPSLIDESHTVDALFGVVNIPNSVWIDEAGMIVRPVEAAWPPPAADREAPPTAELPEGPVGHRMGELITEAGKIISDRDDYVTALRDWVAQGSESEFALSPDEVIERSGPRGTEEATAAAEFELASHLLQRGDLDAARPHFRTAHELQPDNWTYKRQAWSIEPSALRGPRSRFWQGPMPGEEEAWPYPGDWVRDAQAIGGENYYPRFQRQRHGPAMPRQARLPDSPGLGRRSSLSRGEARNVAGVRSDVE